MEKTILSEIRGWTPLIDALVSEHGLVTAAVFGRMWRYSQLKDGVCRASHETIARELGLERKTVIRHVQVLVEHGYLRDLDPKVRNCPHRYADTGKAGLQAVMYATVKKYGAQPGVPETDTKPEEVSPKGTPGVPETDTGCTLEGHPGVPESPMKRVFKRDSKETLEEIGVSESFAKAMEMLKKTLEQTVDGRNVYLEHVKKIKLAGRRNGSVLVYVPDEFSRLWLQERMTTTLEKMFIGFPALRGLKVEFMDKAVFDEP